MNRFSLIVILENILLNRVTAGPGGSSEWGPHFGGRRYPENYNQPSKGFTWNCAKHVFGFVNSSIKGEFHITRTI